MLAQKKDNEKIKYLEELTENMNKNINVLGEKIKMVEYCQK
jgi:hypothetical protein